MKQLIFFIGFSISLTSCLNLEHKEKTTFNDELLQQNCVHRLSEIIVYDVFNPPVASRIYAYSNLAFYEALRFTDTGSRSMAAQLQQFPEMPLPEKNKKYDYRLAAIQAFFKVGIQWTFSKDSLRTTLANYQQQFKSALEEEVYNNSVQFGDTIGATIIKRSMNDNYRQTRGMPRYSVFKEEGKWQQTPPDYVDAVEPNWHKIKGMLLDSSSQFKPAPPPPYSKDKNSVYYKEMMEVYMASKDSSGKSDSIAYYWDDNPFVTKHSGHFMYATKKLTPGGHWMGITGQLCARQQLNALATAKIFALTSCALMDAFIICWDEKYRSRMVRPVTVIREWVQTDWDPFLQTPPFPEYTSGHSVVSSAIATLLTSQLGDQISFTDSTEQEFLGLRRSFPSIRAAADEACISRLYGGIHYRSAIETGKWQGNTLGNNYLNRIQF